MTNISYIAIGNELLKGRIVNTNAAEAGQMLRAQGYALDRVVVIPDEGPAIRQAVEEEMRQHRVVLLSGGLGPTKDDITKHSLAALFQTELVLHAPSLAALEERYRKRNRVLSELNRQQAFVPANCTVLPNPLGTAPGMMFEAGESLLFVMPGVPFEMLRMLQQEVIPQLKTRFAPESIRQEVIRLFDIPESDVAARMEQIEDRLPPVLDISYLPRLDGIWLELTLRSQFADEKAGEVALASAVETVSQHFADRFYALGAQSLPELVAAQFQEKGLSLAVAESLTGGRLSAMIVSVPGVSAFYKGSVTAYAVSVKTSLLQVDPAMIEQHTVVSAPVAEQMAEGVRRLLGADIALATTGLAEADGDRLAQAFVAYADQEGTCSRHVWGYGDRAASIERTAYAALHLCLKKVQARFA